MSHEKPPPKWEGPPAPPERIPRPGPPPAVLDPDAPSAPEHLRADVPPADRHPRHLAEPGGGSGDEVNPTGAPRRARRRPWWPGLLALLLALATIAAVATGVALAASDERYFETASTLALAANISSPVAIVLGLVAGVARLGRSFGIVGAVLAFCANPLVLVHGLDFLGRL